MNSDRSDKVNQARHQLAEAVERRRTQRQGLAGRVGPPQVGEFFLFPGAALLPFRWAAVLKHPDRPLLYAVPADTAPFVGSADVAVAADQPGGPMVLRCTLGLWVDQKDFQPRLRVGVLNPDHLDRAQARLEQIAQGRLDGTAGQRETDASPSYDAWMDEVAAALEALRSMLRDRRLTVSLGESAGTLRLHDPPARPQAEAAVTPTALAAAPDLEELLDELKDGPEVQGVELAWPCPGRLLLVRQEGGIGVRYVAAGEEGPPALAEVRADGQAVPLAWKHTPDRGVCWAAVGWDAGRVVLRLGEGEEAREVTVEP